MELHISYFYPDLMNLYGSWGNVAILKRHLEDLGNTVTVEEIRPNDKASLDNTDFIYMGAGTERNQKVALADFTRYARAVKDSSEFGVAMLFAGNSMHLLGQSITDAMGRYHMGINLTNFNTTQSLRRFVGDVYGHTDLFQSPVVGFMNSCSLTSGVVTPLISSLVMGYGNEKEGGAEGFHKNNVFASELTGPLLVKNPPLLRKVISAIYEFEEEELPEMLPSYPAEERSYQITTKQLKLRSEKNPL